MRVITSALLTRDTDAPQAFTFARVLDVRDFLANAPRTGWAYGDDCEFAEAAVRFSVYDENGSDVTRDVVDMGWMQACEMR